MNLIFCSCYDAHTLSRNLQEIFSVQGAWHSPSTFLTMVHGQAFRIIT